MPNEEMEKSIAEAAKEGLYRAGMFRPPIKLKGDHAKIVVAIPFGDKDDPDMYHCPKCDNRDYGITKCAKCGKEHDARKRLRHAGLAPIEFLLCAWQIVPPLLCGMHFAVRKGVLSAQARNEMTHEAIKMGAKYIFYWDDDTLIPPKAIYDLHNAMEVNEDAAIISGVYVTREPNPEPLIYKNHGEGAYWGFSLEPGIIEPIFAAGAGCMMARIDAIKEVQEIFDDQHWMDEHYITDTSRILWGHDIRFCKRMWEASVTGKTSRPWSVNVAGWVQCGHFDVATQKVYGLPRNSAPFKKQFDANNPRYWDTVWGAEGQESWRRQGYMPLYKRIAELVPHGSYVQDMGCGIGILMEILLKLNQADVYGYDISPKAIEMLKERLLKGEVMDASDYTYLPGSNGVPNVVVAIETLEHLADNKLDHFLEQSALSDMAIFSVPEGELAGTPRGEHVQKFTKASLRKRLKSCFKHVSIETFEIEKGNERLLATCLQKKKEKKVKVKKKVKK